MPVSFPSSAAVGAPEHRPRFVPQMSTAPGCDGAGRRAEVLRA